jgi:DNA polymerase I
LTYGGQAPALAKTLGVPVKKAKVLWDNFWNTNTSLKDFRDRLTNYWRNTGNSKFIKGLDGRKINTRSEHSLVNCAFQSAGIIIMKRALVIWDSWVRDRGLSAETILHVHDEQQVEVDKSLVEYIPVKFEFIGSDSKKEAKEKAQDYRLQYEEYHGRILSAPLEYGNAYYLVYCEVGELGVKSIREAGEFYGMRVPMDAEYKVGRNWAETH